MVVSASSYAAYLSSVFAPMKKYPPVGRCIYCGTTRYRSLSKRPLADEHIVPLSLYGDVELPEASCFRCEQSTGRNEQLALQGVYRPLRHRLNYPHRHKNQPTSFPVFVPSPGGKDDKLLISLDDYPHAYFFIGLPKPGLLLGVPLDYDYIPDSTKSRWFRIQAKPDQPVTSHKLTTFAIPSLDLFSFIKMVAKIAHAYAIAELGYGTFKPLLLDLILSRSNKHMFHLVGGSGTFDPIASPYQISLADVSVENRSLIAVSVRIFATEAASPTYLVIVGYRNGA